MAISTTDDVSGMAPAGELTALKQVPPKRPIRWSGFFIHGVLLTYTFVALAPILLIIVNSFKTRKAIFASPYPAPNADTFNLEGYEKVLAGADFVSYFQNSFVVTATSLLLVVLFSTMAAYALVEYDFPGNAALGIYLALGIMIPIRLGTVSLLKLMVTVRHMRKAGWHCG